MGVCFDLHCLITFSAVYKTTNLHSATSLILFLLPPSLLSSVSPFSYTLYFPSIPFSPSSLLCSLTSSLPSFLPFSLPPFLPSSLCPFPSSLSSSSPGFVNTWGRWREPVSKVWRCVPRVFTALLEVCKLIPRVPLTCLHSLTVHS